MMLGPETSSLPPASMPGTGSIRWVRPGRKRPTVPARNCMGVLVESTGEVSVAP